MRPGLEGTPPLALQDHFQLLHVRLQALPPLAVQGY